MTAARGAGGKDKRKQQQRLLQKERDAARNHAAGVSRQRRLALRAGGILVAAVAIAASLLYALRGTSGTSTATAAVNLGKPDNAVASPPTSGFSKVGAPLMAGKKPVLLFIGAQYCPHCAGQRWPVVKALSQFGSFSGLRQTSSSDGDIPTFDLTHSRYTSAFVSFDHKDVEDENYHNLQPLSGQEQALFSRYDTTGSIPLILVGGYAVNGDAYNLADIEGFSFSSLQTALQGQQHKAIVADIDGEANALTAFLCHADGMKPLAVCTRPAVKTIVASLR